MHLFVVGINHKSASSDIREMVAIPEADQPEALRHLQSIQDVLGSVLISTCNRTEIYLAVEFAGEKNISPQDQDFIGIKTSVLNFLFTFLKLENNSLHYNLFYSYHCDSAVKHLFRVAASLDSLVIGERQILSQIKQAYTQAYEQNSVGSLLNKAFQTAIAVGKRVRSQTRIGEGAVSVSQAAVELSSEIFSDLSGKSILIIGAGEMAQLAATHLQAKNCTQLFFCNRSHEKAVIAAEKFRAKVLPFSELASAMKQFDLIFAATSSRDFLITPEMVKQYAPPRQMQVFMDLSLPRNIDTQIKQFDFIFLYGIDELKLVVAKNIHKRELEISKCGDIISEEFDNYVKWYSKLNLLGVVQKIRDRLESIRRSAIDQHQKKEKKSGRDLENLQTIERISSKIIGKIINDLMSGAEKCQSNKDWQEYSRKLAEVFGLDGSQSKIDS